MSGFLAPVANARVIAFAAFAVLAAFALFAARAVLAASGPRGPWWLSAFSSFYLAFALALWPEREETFAFSLALAFAKAPESFAFALALHAKTFAL